MKGEMYRGVVVAITLAAMARTLSAQQAALVASLVREPSVRAALDAVRAGEPRTIEDQIRFCEVPAPPFKESARGDVLKREFANLGLQNIRADKVGNVLGDRPGIFSRPRLVVAAHLDTVFPEGTDVRVKRTGSVLRGPGIGDNCRGLAVLVAIVRAMGQANVRTPGPVTFVADVGEEGLGDLRGMKALFGETLKGGIDRFVSIDGGGLHASYIAVGSHRYRVTFKGRGGHSFADFGLANPVGALGRAVAKISAFSVPREPRTTFTVGRIGGGTSVNAIPSEAWMEVDMRSSDTRALAQLDARFHEAIDAAVREENDRWNTSGAITATIELVGDRPAGSLQLDSPLVETTRSAARALGFELGLSEGSSDANFPISLNIPGITIGGGGRDIDGHAATEAFDTTEAWKGSQLALLVTIALAR